VYVQLDGGDVEDCAEYYCEEDDDQGPTGPSDERFTDQTASEEVYSA
jgi:hypothetical protein